MDAVGVSGPTRDTDEAVALLRLDALPGVGPVTVGTLVRAFGSATRAMGARFEDFAPLGGAEAARARGDRQLRSKVTESVRRAQDLGISMISWNDTDYPVGLRNLTDPPPVVFLRGAPELLGPRGVTIVGARRATERARDVARRLARELVRAGNVVVSGLALGVDGAAHRGALEGDGGTVAVLGTGADVPYPRTHRRLFDDIVARGLLVSEFLPGTGAAPHHFPRRNRILAALSSTVVVVEASARSGSLITVDHALDLGRDVWAVPGPIEQAACAGSNRLLSDGARPLVAIDHFVGCVSPQGPPEPRSAAPISPAGGGGGDSLQERALALLSAEVLPINAVAGRLEVPVETALSLLTLLELHGEVERLPGMRFRRAA